MAKSWLGRISMRTQRLLIDSHGSGQISLGRANYLAADTELTGWSLEALNDRDHSTRIVALGLAKAFTLYIDTLAGTLAEDQARIVVLTHQAGFMTPQLAAIQSMLKILQKDPSLEISGFMSHGTLSALRNAGVNERWCSASALLNPDIAVNFFADSAGRALFEAASERVGTPLPLAIEPHYEVRRFYTGTIRSDAYATAATTLWRKSQSERHVHRDAGLPLG